MLHKQCHIHCQIAAKDWCIIRRPNWLSESALKLQGQAYLDMQILKQLKDNKSVFTPSYKLWGQEPSSLKEGRYYTGVQCNDRWLGSRYLATKEDVQISEKDQPRRSHYFTDRKKFFAKVDPHHKQWAPVVISQTWHHLRPKETR